MTGSAPVTMWLQLPYGLLSEGAGRGNAAIPNPMWGVPMGLPQAVSGASRRLDRACIRRRRTDSFQPSLWRSMPPGMNISIRWWLFCLRRRMLWYGYCLWSFVFYERRLPAATAGAAYRTADPDLGQCSSPSR